MSNVKLDKIGYWSEVKLDIIRKYAQAYSTIMAAQQKIRKHLYVDGFAGAGLHISKCTQEYVLGSPLNALNVEPPFDEFHFIDLNGGKTSVLKAVVGNTPNVYVYEEDCNELLIKKIFPLTRYEDYHRAFCLLDPYGLDLNWDVMYTAGQMESIEIFLNFPIMDMNRNVLRKNPDKVERSQITRMDRFWGDHTWYDIAYTKTPGLFGQIEEKVRNEAIVKAYQERLKKVADFAYVPEAIPMRNSIGATVYYLFFASPKPTGAKIVKDIFDKYRDRGVR